MTIVENPILKIKKVSSQRVSPERVIFLVVTPPLRGGFVKEFQPLN